MKKQSYRIPITIAYCFGFILGKHSHSWWDLPESILISLVFTFIIFLLLKLLGIYNIPIKNKEIESLLK